jgi:Raf kinase inhibitor-like YbhB/YbcL family protein
MLVLLAGISLCACRAGEKRLATSGAENTAMTIRVTSPAFNHGDPIPQKYATMEDLSPPIAWSNLPPDTKSVAVMVEDPDSPGVTPNVHWIIYNIPPTERGLNEGIPPRQTLQSPTGARQGKNSTMSIGYTRPAPPVGRTHHYHFQVFALAKMLEPRAGAAIGRAEFLRLITGQVLATGEIIGTYQRRSDGATERRSDEGGSEEATKGEATK